MYGFNKIDSLII